MMSLRISLMALCLAAVVGCGADGNTAAADATTSGADAATVDAGNAAWTTLVEGGWTLPSGTEGYTCVYKTLTETLYASAFEPISPLGTHHTVVSIGSPTRADGVYPCQAQTTYTTFIGGSGVGTAAYILPEGVALKLPAGQQILLNLHLFNTSESELSGTSGMKIKTIPQAQVVHEAESIVAGPLNFVLPTGPSDVTAQCTMAADVTLISVFPHMHMLGTHMRIEANRAVGGTLLLHDQAYNFDNQINYDVGLVELSQGDTVNVTCSYNNTTGQPVSFGDSSLQEMCFVGLLRYPAIASIPICFN